MRTQLPPGGAGGEGGASGTPPAPTGALSQFWGTKFGFKTHTARTQTQSTGAGCVSSQEQISSPQNRACHQATHGKKVGPPHSQHPSPWVSVTVPRVLSQPCLAKNKKTQRQGVGQSPAQPAWEGHGAPSHPHTLWEACQGPPTLGAQPRVADHCISTHSQHKQITWAASPCTGRCPKHLPGLSSPPPSFRGN